MTALERAKRDVLVVMVCNDRALRDLVILDSGPAMGYSVVDECQHIVSHFCEWPIG